jgi:uncharacterized membrane protein YvbJ
MFCQTCGTQLQPGDRFCPKCGGAAPTGQMPPAVNYAAANQSGSVPTYLVQSILVTLFCCMPFGVVSIVFAAQVNGKLAAGDYQGAVSASNSAKTWSTVAFLCGLAAVILWLIMAALGVSQHRIHP